MSDLSAEQALELAGHLAAIGDLAGALARCGEIRAADPGHAGARRLAASIRCRSGLIAAYRINLDKRPERLDECRANEAEHGFPEGFVRRLRAVEDADYGALGCGKSHIAALTDFFIRSRSPHCMVLEDDFDFRQPIEALSETLGDLEASGLAWDVLLLAGWKVMPLHAPPAAPSVLQVFESTTASGYIVNRPYIPTLLASFTHSVAQMESFRAFQPRKGLITMRFAIDMAWHELQRRDRWFIANPALGHQRPGFSDNESSYQDYTKDAFYSWP